MLSSEPRASRLALIRAALCGWAGDEPSNWPWPVDRPTIIAWAQSHDAHATEEDLHKAFTELVCEGLFFKIGHDVFADDYFYCSMSSAFLQELPDRDKLLACTGEPVLEFWPRITAENDHLYGPHWRKYGLCAGMGSQGPSDSPWGPCKGPNCCWYRDGDPGCWHELVFNRKVKA